MRHTLYSLQADYPAALRDLEHPPDEITLSTALEPGVVVAIVGTRHACDASLRFAERLARAVARAGGVVASGGAVGLDTAAHEGALAAGGVTWCVVPSGADRVVPASGADLFQRIEEAAPSAMIWPFPLGHDGGPYAPYFARNAVLAALATAVVVVEAPLRSGARNTAKWARALGRSLWAVPAPILEPESLYAGSHQELGWGARPLYSIPSFLRDIGLTPAATEPDHAEQGQHASTAPPPPKLGEIEKQVLLALSNQPRHMDELAAKLGLSAPVLATALLTLALEDVVVEGPSGLFRRK